MRFIPFILASMALVSCGGGKDDGPLEIAMIGAPSSPFQQGLRLSPPAQQMRAATNEGLVAFDPSGQIVPALAERWIVTDDGLSYIFRLRNSEWPGGSTITASEIRDLLNQSRQRLRGTSLGLDLAKIEDVRAMTGRVVEVRLKSPMPDFLRLMAQPELGFVYEGGGSGPMILSVEDGAGILSALPPEMRGEPAREDWEETARQLRVRAMDAKAAIDEFASGDVDVVMGGKLASLPLVDTGPLSRGTVRLDNMLGLFGLVVRNDKGLLADPALREALSMAIDRNALIQPFNVGGWEPTTRIVSPQVSGAQSGVGERWQARSIEQRQAEARGRVAAWRRANDTDPLLKIGLADGPGNVMIFKRIAEDLAAIGVRVERVEPGKGADLELHDRIARFGGARWFLDQFNCTLKVGLCSEEADDLVRQAIDVQDPAERDAMLGEAERELLSANVFIPFGPPIRWSLVRSNVTGFASNAWGVHPLFPLSQPPI